MKIDLPYPPSMNHYWRRVGARTLISKEGRAFRERVQILCRQAQAGTMEGPLVIRIWAHPPDTRARDLDNLLKAPLDAMQHGGLYLDDGQIDEIHLHRGQCIPGGKLEVEIWPQEGPQACDSDDLRKELERRASELKDELESVLEALKGLWSE